MIRESESDGCMASRLLKKKGIRISFAYKLE